MDSCTKQSDIIDKSWTESPFLQVCCKSDKTIDPMEVCTAGPYSIIARSQQKRFNIKFR